MPRTTRLTIAVDSIADVGSGVEEGTRSLERAEAVLTDNTCGPFDTFRQVATPPVTAITYSDTQAIGKCYRYQYRFTDALSNEFLSTSPNTAKIKPTYSSVVTGTNGLVDYFRLGDNVTPVVDSQGGDNKGISDNPPTLRADGAIAADSNTAASFDRANDYLRINRTIADDFSIELWFRSTQGSGTGTEWWRGAGLVDAEVAGAANDFGVSLAGDGRVLAGVGNPDTTASSAAGFNDGQWHHVVMTRRPSTGVVVLYVDGTQRSTVTGNTLSLNAPANIDFGRISTGANYYRGSLDEVALYTVALTPAQVQSHYYNALP